MDTVTTVLLWLLGVVFLGAGAMKALMPAGMMAGNEQMAWVEREGIAKARIAGVTEIAAAAAFIGTAVGVLESGVLAGIAALGIVVQMGLAAFTVHQPNDEPIVPNLVLAALALVLAIGAFTT